MEEEDNISYDTDQVEPISETGKKNYIGPTAQYVLSQFQKAENKKRVDEERLLRAYQNFRGIYGSDVTFTESEKSRVFVKVTKTKVLAAYEQIADVMFGGNRFPLTIDPSKLPDGVSEAVHMEGDPNIPPSPEASQALKGPVSPFGTRDGPPLPKGATIYDLKRAGPLQDKLSSVADRLVEGPGTTPTAITFNPALVAAKRMEKKIHDQLDASGSKKQLRSSIFEMALFGTGVMKGPWVEDREYPSWSDTGEYKPLKNIAPNTGFVSVWNSYPDPEACNMEECEFFIERHKNSRTDLSNLKRRPYFREDDIDAAILDGANYEKKWWEFVMEDGATSIEVDRWEVLEFWGFIPVTLLEEMNVPISPEIRKMDQVSANIWVCGGHVLRFVLNPFKPARIPYYAVPYEHNPYSFFGVGVAENMEDTQTLMNGFMRMAVDNAVLSGNVVFEVDETYLVPGQDLEFYPGKVIRREGGAPGQALFATKFPNTTNENLMMFDKARVLADESTGLPSYSYGQTGVQGVGRTASGISMLMNAASGSIKTVIKNLDEYLLAPLGQAFYSFNMQYAFDPTIVGDLEVNARGTESLMANEVRSQRLMQFLGVVMNPMLAPFVKMDNVVREIAISMDLDPDSVTNSLADASVQAALLKNFRAEDPSMMGGAPQGAPPAPAGLGVNDTQGSGGASMGTGSVPSPGMQGFSANTGAQ